jgi:hypothetical protein
MGRLGLGMGLGVGRRRPEPDGTVRLAGSVAGSSSVAGALSLAVPLGGIVSGQAAVAAALSLGVPLGGSVAGSATVAGALDVTSSWSPSSHSNLLLDLDGQGSNVLWQDTSATTPSDAGGEQIQRWNASTGTNVTNSTAGTFPAYGTINGKAAVDFDGTDDRLTSAQTFSAGTKTFAIVFQYDSAPTTTERDDICNLGSTANQLWFSTGGNTASLGRLSWGFDKTAASTTFVGTDGYTADLTRRIVIITYNGGSITAAASYRCWVDGVEQTIVTRVTAAGAAGTTSIGARSTGAQAFNGRVGQVVLWGADHSADAATIHNGLNGRWL